MPTPDYFFLFSNYQVLEIGWNYFKIKITLSFKKIIIIKKIHSTNFQYNKKKNWYYFLNDFKIFSIFQTFFRVFLSIKHHELQFEIPIISYVFVE